ncbi:hypothetical protein [Candidatus Nephthysia bennettiae]|uniref:Uncharacterized protein n=1 Tax=Candidatus Nephthysia bennettiae TaxID=3127016 RepID=A0A934KBE1_9BACT|nr:hypothetical protein [Candidatus Dormibacteraeota bacterium]MBJ7613368.1 hypothetical protein [Candidatus Dormibacteraeota bacterium]
MAARPPLADGPAGPADACPYRRPFPEDFDECLTYQATMFVGLDLQYRPLRPSRTCRFLTVGEVSGLRGTFYGRCALGDSSARQRWMNRIDRERLHKLQELRGELSAFLKPSIEELWRLKGDQLRAQRQGDGEDPTAFTEALRALADRMTEGIDTFFDSRAQTLDELQMPRESLVQLTRLTLDAFVDQATSEQAEVELPSEVLSRFPPEVLALMRPESSVSSQRS